ncbi:ATP-binding protein [Bacillus coreaensis]
MLIYQLLVNAFFLFLFCCFVPLTLMFNEVKPKTKLVLLTVSTSIAIIACISLPIKLDNGIIFDLRLIAQTYGSLYGGPIVAIILGIVNISYRSVQGGIGVVTTVIISSSHIVILIMVRKWYLKITSISYKLLFAIVFSLTSSFLTLFVISLFSKKFISIELVLIYVSLQTLGLVIVIYNEEIVRKQWILRQSLYDKMRTVSHFAASISHEIRNPLTTARGFIQMLVESKDVQEKEKSFLEISLGEIDRAEGIIGDYLNFAKPNVEVSKSTLDVKAEIHTILKILEPIANMNVIEVTSKLERYYIVGNKQLFQQCLVNICKNAIESMTSQSSRTLTLSTTVKEGFGIISVKDTGIGMTQEEVNRLGEPYFTTKGAKGTGLGTMLVFHLVKEMGGSIQISSKKQVGTEFILSFPLTNSEIEIDHFSSSIITI